MSRERAFVQVDVFTAVPYRGNPVAVVLDGDGVDDATMQRFAAWTNLSETTFVQPATDPTADYRLRIFTTTRELPFAGHPTLGSAHAWLEAGGVPAGAAVVQECRVGLVRVRRDGARLAFAAPPTQRSGALEPALLTRVRDGLGLATDAVLDAQWVDNGPGWLAVLLRSPEELLALEPSSGPLAELAVGAAALRPDGGLEVRAFVFHGGGSMEDPVTGSLNAGLAQWLQRTGRLPGSYVARQGSRVGRDGRVSVAAAGGDVWVGGDSVTCVRGTVQL